MGISNELHPGVFVQSISFQGPAGILLEFAAWSRSSAAADVSHSPAVSAVD